MRRGVLSRVLSEDPDSLHVIHPTLAGAMHVCAPVSYLGLQQLVCDFSYRKPIWVQMIKDPNPLPFTAETRKAITVLLERLVGASQGVSAVITSYLQALHMLFQKTTPSSKSPMWRMEHHRWNSLHRSSCIASAHLHLFIEIRDSRYREVYALASSLNRLATSTFYADPALPSEVLQQLEWLSSTSFDSFTCFGCYPSSRFNFKVLECHRCGRCCCS